MIFYYKILGVSQVDTNKVSDAKTVLDTNVMGVIALCSAFIPGMKKRGEGIFYYV